MTEAGAREAQKQFTRRRGVKSTHFDYARASRRICPGRGPRSTGLGRRRGASRLFATSPFAPSLLGLCGEGQRMALGAPHVGRARRLGLSDVAFEYGDDADAESMRRHHHAVGLILAETELRLQHHHDELARRIIVVQQDHLVQARPLGLGVSFRARLRVDVAHEPTLLAQTRCAPVLRTRPGKRKMPRAISLPLPGEIANRRGARRWRARLPATARSRAAAWSNVSLVRKRNELRLARHRLEPSGPPLIFRLLDTLSA